MFKRIIILATALIGLSGCAHNHWVGPAVVGGVIGYGIATHNYQPVYVQPVCYMDPNQYNMRINMCDAQFRSNPHYNIRHRDACYQQAKQQAQYCR